MKTNLSLLLFILILTMSCVKKDNDGYKPMVIAHQGGSKLAPENTLSAFQNALKLGVDMVDIDVHLSKDGELIVMHDFSIEKTTNGTGEIKYLTLEELKKVDAGSWFDSRFTNERIPTLEETLALINSEKILFIEVKGGNSVYPGIEQKVVDEIKKYNALKWVIVKSFDLNSILRIKKLYPELSTFYLSGKTFEKDYISIKKNLTEGKNIQRNFDGIAIHFSKLDAEKVETIKKYGLKVFTYTVNEKSDLRKVIAMKVDGIVTDAPDIMIELLQN